MADPEKRIGRQTPTKSIIIPYTASHGQEAIDLYNSSGRTCQEWQELLLYDILAVNDDGLWTHTKFGMEIPRRNGKNEVLTMVEFYGLVNGERILHTAHRTTTSSSASRRLAKLLTDSGYEEVVRPKKGEKYDKHFSYTKQLGLERITMLGDGGGVIDFRTRSAKGGLGEGFDLLVIDEAQEYTDDQESALKYVVTDSKNPHTIFLGTPPTTVSSGTIFPKLRTAALQGETENTGWAEWSIDEQTDPHNVDAWYETNPSLGTIFTERSIRDEIGGDPIDFNIQRLGLWLRYNQKSAISKNEWQDLEVNKLPQLTGKLHVGIKYGHDNDSVAVSIAVRTADGDIFVEAIDCRPIRDGDDWILGFLASADISQVVVDGANGQSLLLEKAKKRKIRAPLMPTVKQIIEANAAFSQLIYARKLRHMGQPSVTQIVANCQKRAIGSNGGYGFASILDGAKIELLDSLILAAWSCSQHKVKAKQKVSY